MKYETQTQIINGHKITIGHSPYSDQIIMKFPWIQIDDGIKYYVDIDGDHWGSIGISNPETMKGTIIEQYISYNDGIDSYEFDMGGQFFIFGDHGYTELVDYNDIITPLGLIDNYEGAYGNG